MEKKDWMDEKVAQDIWQVASHLETGGSANAPVDAQGRDWVKYGLMLAVLLLCSPYFYPTSCGLPGN